MLIKAPFRKETFNSHKTTINNDLAKVILVIDGETIVFEGGETRSLGINLPELGSNRGSIQ